MQLFESKDRGLGRIGRGSLRLVLWGALALAGTAQAREPTAEELNAHTQLMTQDIAAMGKSDWAASVVIRRQILDLLRRTRGPQDPSTVDSIRMYALAHEMAGNYPEARKLLAEYLDLARKSATTDQSAIFDALTSYGSVEARLGDTAAARRLHGEALVIARQRFKPGSAEYLEAIGRMATAMGLAGDSAGSRNLNREYLELSRKLPNPVQWRVFHALTTLGGYASDAREYAEAEAYYRQGIELARREWGTGSTEYLRALDGLAFVNSMAGKSVEQEKYLREAIAIRRAQSPVPQHELGKSVTDLGTALISQGRLAEAQKSLEEGIALLTRGAGSDHADTISARETLGAVYLMLGRTAEATANLEANHAAAASRFGVNSSEALNAEIMKASIYIISGKEAEAEAILRRVTAVSGNSPDKRHIFVSALGTMGSLLSSQKRWEEAEKIFRQQLTHQEQISGKDHPLTVTPLSSLANSLANRGELAQAETYIERAIALERKQSSKSVNFLMLLGSQGDIAQKRGAFKRAYELHLQASAIAEQVLGRASIPYAAEQNRLGDLAEKLQRFDDAQKHYRASIAAVRAIKLPLIDPMANLARLTNDPREALDLAREAVAATRARRAAILSGGDGRQDLRSANRATGLERVADDPRSYYYLRLADVAWVFKDSGVSRPDVLREEAFVAAQEAYLSRAAQAMARTAARASAGKGKLGELVAEQQKLTTRVKQLQDKQIEALTQGGQDGATYFAMIAEAGTRLTQIDSEIDRRFPEFRAMLNPAPMSGADVAKALKPGEGLLFIVRVLDRVMAYAIGPGGASWHRSDLSRTEIDTIQKRLVCQLDEAACPDAKSAAGSRKFFDLAGAHRLYADIVRPVEGALKGAKRVYVVNQGEFGRLPLTLLPTSSPPAARGDAGLAALAATDWLADRYTLINLPSVASLRLAGKAGKPAPQAFIGYGAPALRGVAPSQAELARSVPVQGLADVVLLQSLKPLPGTAGELQAMASSLGADGRAIRLGAASTEAAVRADKAIGQSRVVTFATHSLMPGELEGFDEPGLVFSPPARPSPQDDGVLSASEASTLSLNADWVILSACNTASGMEGAETLSGLARAFLFAGARSLLVSHWGVKDTATANLTVETLREDRSRSRGEALQAAMKTLRSGKRVDGSALEGWRPYWAHPSYWAGFSLIANTDQ